MPALLPRHHITLLLLAFAFLLSGDLALAKKKKKAKTNDQQYNVILIMADDIGYECYGVYGSKEYSTPNIDRLAKEGIRFTNAHSQPVCTPSRVKIMTGLSNVRNYATFTILKRESITFGHRFKEAGYATAIAGKWQLYGARDFMGQYAAQGMHPKESGFDEYCLWHVTHKSDPDKPQPSLDTRYWNPVHDVNGEIKHYPKDAYGPDITTQFICDFIEKNKNNPFFVYYPMALPHSPFLPTPDSADRTSTDRKQNFVDMVAYMDKLIGRIAKKVEDLDIDKKTLILITGDNGTNKAIKSQLFDRVVQGGKGKTTDAGTHVALVGWMPGTIPADQVNTDLVNFADIMPTIFDMANAKLDIGTEKYPTDGISFAPQLRGKPGNKRDIQFCYYKVHNTSLKDQKKRPSLRYVFDENWKLYHDGRLFHLKEDILEKKPISIEEQTEAHAAIRKRFQEELNKWPEEVPLFIMDKKKKGGDK